MNWVKKLEQAGTKWEIQTTNNHSSFVSNQGDAN